MDRDEKYVCYSRSTHSNLSFQPKRTGSPFPKSVDISILQQLYAPSMVCNVNKTDLRVITLGT
jgi:hypothetical protein